MSWAIVFDCCFGCDRPFGFNPLAVPSCLVEGVRRPICADCVARVNPIRRANGLTEIIPAADAYEPIEAERLL